jgi:hypothetical protein
VGRPRGTKARALAAADVVPLFKHGQNLGTANMSVQQISYRDMLVLMMPHHSAVAPKVAGVRGG